MHIKIKKLNHIKDIWEQFGGVRKTNSFCSYVGETRRWIGVSVEEGNINYRIIKVSY